MSSSSWLCEIAKRASPGAPDTWNKSRLSSHVLLRESDARPVSTSDRQSNGANVHRTCNSRSAAAR